MSTIETPAIHCMARLAQQVWADGDMQLNGTELAQWLAHRPEGVSLDALCNSRVGLVLHVAAYSWHRIA